MSSAKGSITSKDGKTFTGIFNINEHRHSCSGSFQGAIPPFKSINVELKYNKDEDLFGIQNYTGDAGATKILLTLDNGVTMSGTLAEPIDKAYKVSGSVTWDV